MTALTHGREDGDEAFAAAPVYSPLFVGCHELDEHRAPSRRDGRRQHAARGAHQQVVYARPPVVHLHPRHRAVVVQRERDELQPDDAVRRRRDEPRARAATAARRRCDLTPRPRGADARPQRAPALARRVDRERVDGRGRRRRWTGQSAKVNNVGGSLDIRVS